jgi:O-antigen/teichoic acid export membrane protein
MSIREQIAKGVVWSATNFWGKQIISFFIFVALSRLLGPEAFGLVALASVFIAFITIFVEQGLGEAIVQQPDLEPEHLDTAFWTSILVGGLLTVISMAASGLVAKFFQEMQLQPIVWWLSLSFILAALSSTQKAILRRHLDFKSLALRSMVQAIIAGITGVSLAFLGFGVWSLVAQTLVSGLTGAIVLWQVSDWRPRLNFSKKHFRELFAFGLNIIGIDILDFFNRRSDDLLIGYFLGPVMLGYYTIAYRLLLVMIQLLTGISTAVAFPAFSRLQRDPEKMRRAFYQAIQYTSLIAFPAFFGVSAIAPELVLALFGPKWAPSVPVMQILAMVGILHSVSLFNASVLKANGKPSWQLGLMLATSICNVIGFLLVVRLGIVAVAISFVIVNYLLSPISILAVRSLIQIDFRTYLRQYVAPLTSSLAMVAFVLGLKYIVLSEGLDLRLRLFIYILGGFLTYLLVIQLTARSISRQVLELIRLVLPNLNLRKV